MNARHKRERDDLNRAREDQLGRFNQLYENQMKEFDAQGDDLQKKMKQRHND